MLRLPIAMDAGKLATGRGRNRRIRTRRRSTFALPPSPEGGAKEVIRREGRRSEAVITARDLTCRFGFTVRRVSFTIERGEISVSGAERLQNRR
jgi:hypothetical protein